jgi:SAM-dependent methyltransferase
MNAEALDFPSESFDLVFGSGVLHHLNLESAYSGIARVLRPGGKAVFIEPLGHNPIINWFRNRTPDMRTPDEHPLLMRDIKLAKQFFDIEIKYFSLCSIAAKWCKPLLVPLETLDRQLFSWIPSIRKHAWLCVIQMTPKTDNHKN